MPTVYKHGIYGEAGQAVNETNTAQVTIPVYIGTLPVQRMGASVSNYINKPFIISSYRDVKNMDLYSDDWAHYSLCEAIYTHFMNGEVVGPIAVVNMLNPTAKQAQTATEVTVALTKEGNSYVGYISDPICLISTMTITVTDVTLQTGDYSYAYEGDKVKITITKSGFNKTSLTATYNQLSYALTDFTTSDFGTALDSLDYMEQITSRIPNILVAPVYSEIPEYHDLIIQKANNKLAEKWNLICVSDIPATVTTRSEVISWKQTNSYNSKLDKAFWPVVTNDGTHKVHLSTVAAYTMQLTDMNNDGIPYISPSNKVINFTNICDSAGNPVYMMDADANELNEVGITTVIPMRGTIRLWGSHMSNYNFASLDSIADEDKFDICIRMEDYIFNYLQSNYIDEIDESVSRKDIDSIINSIQIWLNSLVNQGCLLYGIISFDDTTDFPNGDLVFDLEVTYPVVAKSITFKLRYTNTGLTILNATNESE